MDHFLTMGMNENEKEKKKKKKMFHKDQIYLQLFKRIIKSNDEHHHIQFRMVKDIYIDKEMKKDQCTCVCARV